MFASNYNMFFPHLYTLRCNRQYRSFSLSRNQKLNWKRSSGRTKKMTCYKRLIYKQFIQVSGLCGPQFLTSYLPKRFTNLCRALYGDAILVHRFVGNSKYQVKGIINFDFGIFFGRKILASIFIECFHSRGQHPCKFIGTKESVYIRKDLNSHRTGLGHQHGRRFIVLGHQYGRRDVM